MNLAEMKNKHILLKEFDFEIKELYRGYADRTLYINLDDNTIKEKTVPQQMKEKFIGGKGYGLKMLWDATKPDTKWDDPENEIVISPGPIAGITQYAGAGKSLVVAISPMTDIVIDSNVGGYFGPFLKFAGYDVLELQGKAKNDVIIVIDGAKGKITIEEAPAEAMDSHILAEQLTEMYSDSDAPRDMKNISVISAGMAAEHTMIGMLNFSWYDIKRKNVRLKQAGRGGIGTILRNKKIKAVVVKTTGVTADPNHVADMAPIKEKGAKFAREMKELDPHQCRMKQEGTAHLVNIMNDYNLLPTNNFQYGSHKDADNLHSRVWNSYFTQGMNDGCWIGCTMNCAKAVDNFELKSGPYKGDKVIVDGPEYETAAGVGSNMGIFDPETVIELNFYCDTYGIDTISFGTMTAFAMECFEKGLITKENTGGLDLSFGNIDSALELIHQMARGDGFGKIVGLGTRGMKKYFAENFGSDPKFMQDIGMENKGLEYSQYVSKESLAQQGGYAMTNKGPQHDEAWLIFMDMVNNQIPTFDDKAEALHYFPMFRTWFGLMGLCKLPWNDVEPESNATADEPAKVPEHVENYIAIYNAVTGQNIDKVEMIRQSERVYNYQRTFNIRRGYGLRKHDAQPYRAAGPVTVAEYESLAEQYDKQMKEDIGVDPDGKSIEEKIAITRKYREDRYEQLLDSVYKRRGWTPNGVPTLDHMKDLGMDLPEVMEVLSKHQ